MDDPKTKRNQNPGDVRVMSLADFSGQTSLDDRTDALVENRNEVAIHNIEQILKMKNLTQARMCAEGLEGSPQPSQIASYKTPGRDIPFRTVARIGLAYGYTPEQMYGQLLDHSDQTAAEQWSHQSRSAEEHRKCLGTYHMAFFGTDAKLGGNRRTTARSLAMGMLSVYPGDAVNGIPTLRVAAFLNCTEGEQEQLLKLVQQAERSGSASAVPEVYRRMASQGDMLRMKCLYEGTMTLTDRIAEICLHQVKGSDVVHMELHNRAANSSDGRSYKGGLATMMSTSRGEEHMPCIQAAILSKRGFETIAREELARQLDLEPPTIDLQEETKSIITYLKALFPSDDEQNPLSALSEADKAFMLESFIEKKLSEVIRRNVLSYYKISTEMDSKIYKAVCR